MAQVPRYSPEHGQIIIIRTEVAKVMFLQASVCPWGGICLSACWDTPPEQTPPGADTPGADTPQSRPPQEQTPPSEQTPPRSRHPPRADTPQSRYPQGADIPSQERWPLLRTVRILLECILVSIYERIRPYIQVLWHVNSQIVQN